MTATVTFTGKSGPIAGLSVKETPTTKDNLTGQSVPTIANKEPAKIDLLGAISDKITATLRVDDAPHTFTPEDASALQKDAASVPYDRTTDQTLTFSMGKQTCQCTYSETLSNVDSQGKLNTQTNSEGTNFTFTTTKPVVQRVAPKKDKDQK